jgi:hypothetical protein
MTGHPIRSAKLRLAHQRPVSLETSGITDQLDTKIETQMHLETWHENRAACFPVNTIVIQFVLFQTVNYTKYRTFRR